MRSTRDAADRCTGRALALALSPGLAPFAAVGDLVALAQGDPVPLEIAAARFRACLRDTPDSEWARLALDLCQEALADPGVVVVHDLSAPSSAPSLP